MAIENIGLQIRTPSDPQLRLEFDAANRTEFRNNGAGVTQISDTGDRLEYLGGNLEIIPQIASQNAVLVLRGNGGGVGLITSQVNRLEIFAPAFFRCASFFGDGAGQGMTLGDSGTLRMLEGGGTDNIRFLGATAAPSISLVAGAVTPTPNIRIYAEPDTANSDYLRIETNSGLVQFRSVTVGVPTVPLTEYRFNDLPAHFETQLRAGVGALATPPISFEGDRDTGFFNNVDGSVQFISNGVAVGGFDATGLIVNIDSITLLDASAVAPSLNFVGSLTTGLFSPGVGIFGITTVTVERFRISAANLEVTVPIIPNASNVLDLGAVGFEWQDIHVLGLVDGRNISTDGATLDALALANSVDVTLAGQTYLTIAGQLITAAQINLTTQVTGILPAAQVGFPLLAPDGSAAVPSYSFVNNPDTGIYYSATQLNFSVDAASRMGITATGIVMPVGRSITITPTAYAGAIVIGSGFMTATNSGAQSPTLTLGVPGQTSILHITAAGGAADWTWPAGVRWSGGTPPVLSVTAGLVDVVYFTEGVGGSVEAAATLGHA